MIGEYIYYFGPGREVNDMFFHKKEDKKEQQTERHTSEKVQKSRKLSHEAAARILDLEWKHHPGGG